MLKISNIRSYSFWQYQIYGWLIFFSVEAFILIISRGFAPKPLIDAVLEVAVGFVFSLVLWTLYRKVQYQSIQIATILLFVTVSSFVVTVLWVYTLTATFIMLYDSLERLRSLLYVKKYFRAFAVLFPIQFGWSVLYFGIRFWRDWDTERGRAAHASELAQQAQLQMLRYQLNPHFLFNALNSIRALIDEDTRNAKTMITELSEFLRYSLLSRNRQHVTLKDEFDAIKHYISIEKRRYEDKLDVTFSIDPKTEQYSILSFLIHPIIENAIKYGMKTSSMPLRLKIKTSQSNGNLKISVVNSGSWHVSNESPQSELESTGTGLENVRARLENYCPGSYSLLTSEKDGYVHINLELHNVQEIL